MHFIFLENVFGLYFCLFFFVNKVIPMQLPIKGVWPVSGVSLGVGPTFVKGEHSPSTFL